MVRKKSLVHLIGLLTSQTILMKKEKHPKWGESCATIWDGTKITFSKSDGANPNEEANQDRITDNVWITRANDGGQIYNIAKENSSNKTNSPIGTKWAIGSLDEIDNLTFDKFRATVGNPKDVVGKKLVMYLEEDNIYLSVIFTSWSEGKKKEVLLMKEVLNNRHIFLLIQSLLIHVSRLNSLVN